MENKQLKAEKVSIVSSHGNSNVVNTAGTRRGTCTRESCTSSSTQETGQTGICHVISCDNNNQLP